MEWNYFTDSQPKISDLYLLSVDDGKMTYIIIAKVSLESHTWLSNETGKKIEGKLIAWMKMPPVAI